MNKDVFNQIMLEFLQRFHDVHALECSEPSFDGVSCYELTQENVEKLRSIGVQVSGRLDGKNFIFLSDNAKNLSVNIIIYGESNFIFFGKETRSKANLTVTGKQNIACIVGEGGRNFNFSLDCRANNSALIIGKDCSAASVNFWLEGTNKSIVLGDDAQCSWGIWIRSGGGHAIVDLSQGIAMNRTEDVFIASHVWLGQDVIINPGACIGKGSIVGARAVVTKGFPDMVSIAGVPAKIVKKFVSWTRSASPSDSDVRAVMEKLGVEFNKES